jgi:FtsP/CotA-like multicopper oxidase with cupredoxin domain
MAGLDLARDEPPDRVLLDLMRPGLNGWAVQCQPKGDALTLGSTLGASAWVSALRWQHPCDALGHVSQCFKGGVTDGQAASEPATLSEDRRPAQTSISKAMAGVPDYVCFNGYANQYVDHPLTAKVGELVRLWVLNAGPSHFSAFHVIGTIFEAAYQDGNPANKMVGMQTVNVNPGGGIMVEFRLPEAGKYPFVTHSFVDATKGAVGALVATHS